MNRASDDDANLPGDPATPAHPQDGRVRVGDQWLAADAAPEQIASALGRDLALPGDALRVVAGLVEVLLDIEAARAGGNVRRTGQDTSADDAGPARR